MTRYLQLLMLLVLGIVFTGCTKEECRKVPESHFGPVPYEEEDEEYDY